jgi:hypothetical protein
MDEPVQDAIRYSGITDLFVPTSDGHLGGQDHAPSLITLLADSPEVPAFGFGQRCHGPVDLPPFFLPVVIEDFQIS